MEEMRLPSKPQFVTVFDTSKSLSDAPVHYVIPPIPNNLFPSNSATASDSKGGGGWRRAGDVMFDRFLEDMSRLPHHRGFDEFADIPVDSYAAAILTGYGWSKGMGLGRKRKIGEVQSSDSEKIGAGRHAGQKGMVVERSGRKIMLQSSEEVQVAELGSAAEDKCLKKLKELEIRDRDERRDSDEEAKPVDKSSGGGGGVRGGKLYEQKGDVVGPRTCDITMDGSGELVQGVDQEMLETAQPKYGDFLLLLYGKHKGVFGSPVERDMEEVGLDEIAEYVGDPGY